MSGSLKRDERLIECGSALRHTARPPIASMTGKRVGEVMMTNIIAALVWIGPRFRGVNQRQPQHIVCRLVPTILAVVENRRAKSAALVSHIGPLLARRFSTTASMVG